MRIYRSQPNPVTFNVTLVDHLHLTCDHVVRSQQTHEAMAVRLARRAWQTLIVEGVLLTSLAATAVAAAVMGGRPSAVAAGVLAVLALVTCVGYVVANFEPRIHAHRWSAAHLWLHGERYRALLSDLHDAAIGPDTARNRRDALMQGVQRVFEHAPPIGQLPRPQTEHVDEMAGRLTDGSSSDAHPLSAVQTQAH